MEDYELAKSLLERAAKNGHLAAAKKLGLMMVSERTEASLSQALSLFSRYSIESLECAMWYHAVFALGKRISFNMDFLEKELQKEALQNSASACEAIALFYLCSDWLNSATRDKALDWLRKAALAGSISACATLLEFLFQYPTLRLPGDAKIESKLHEAYQNDLPGAAGHLAKLTHRNIIARRYEREPLDLAKIAWDQNPAMWGTVALECFIDTLKPNDGDVESFLAWKEICGSAFALGVPRASSLIIAGALKMHKNPILCSGVTIEILEHAAMQGDSKASMQLYAHYYNQNDYIRAAAWVQNAADEGNLEAMTTIGSALCYGITMQKDVATGIAWLKAAASQDYGDAAEELGTVFAIGLTIPNLEASRQWFTKAIELGSFSAKYGLADYSGNGQVLDSDDGFVEVRPSPNSKGTKEIRVKTSKVIPFYQGLRFPKKPDSQK